MKTNNEVWRQVIRGLGSVGRLKVLRALASSEAPSLTKYGLEGITGLKPVHVRKHLKILIETGWVKEHDFQPPAYSINFDDPKTNFLVDFFERIDRL